MTHLPYCLICLLLTLPHSAFPSPILQMTKLRLGEVVPLHSLLQQMPTEHLLCAWHCQAALPRHFLTEAGCEWRRLNGRLPAPSKVSAACSPRASAQMFTGSHPGDPIVPSGGDTILKHEWNVNSGAQRRHVYFVLDEKVL